MIEDKEYPVKVTDEMILKYENMVYKVFNRIYGSAYRYLEKDLLQCGRWGVFLAYQRYARQNIQDKCEFPCYVWLHIRNKMWQYIDHEKHHIHNENSVYDNEYEYEPFVNVDVRIDIDYVLNLLKPKDRYQIIQWANEVEFKDMGFKTKQNSHKHFKVTLKRLKEKLKGYEL